MNNDETINPTLDPWEGTLDDTITKMFKCQCKITSIILVPATTKHGIYINEQPCKNCGCYMGTVQYYQPGDWIPKKP
jgi:hypothetical protein